MNIRGLILSIESMKQLMETQLKLMEIEKDTALVLIMRCNLRDAITAITKAKDELLFFESLLDKIAKDTRDYYNIKETLNKNGG